MPTWEDIALEVTMSSIGVKCTYMTNLVKWSRIYYDWLIWYHLCAMWTSGRVSALQLLVQSPVVEITVYAADET